MTSSLSLWVLAAAIATSPSTEDVRVDAEVRRAALYIKKERDVAARKVVESILSSPSGRLRARAWLALAELDRRQGRWERAGQALARAVALGVPDPAKDPWQDSLLRDFGLHLGRVRLLPREPSEDGSSIRFSVSKEAPLLDELRSEVFESRVDVESSRMNVVVGQTFFFPVGRFRFGGGLVEVRAGRLVEVSLDNVTHTPSDPAPFEPLPQLVSVPSTAPSSKEVCEEPEVGTRRTGVDGASVAWLLGAVAFFTGSVIVTVVMSRGEP